MKKLLVLFAILCAPAAFSQQTCDELDELAAKYLEPSKESTGVFISDGQVYTAFFAGDAEEEAEFPATFYGGSTYRIAATAGSKDNYVIFELRDIENNVLFSNEEFKNEPYWDFEFESTLDLNIVLKLDPNKKDSGCATMLIGFQQ